MAKKVKLKCTIHNPNSIEDTTAMLLKLLIEINKPKADEIIRAALESSEETMSHPA